MKELKRQFNYRVNSEMNISFTITDLTEDEDEAEAVGRADRKMIDAYINGYAQTDASGAA